MKLFDIRWATALSTVILALNSYAGDEDGKKQIVPMEQPAVSRWSLSLGATVSSIKSTFNSTPGLFNELNADTGSMSLYTGGAEQVYQNGVVGIGGPNDPHTNSTGAIYDNPSQKALQTTGPFAGLTTLTFNSASFAPGSSSSDTELSVGPYIKLAYDALDFGGNTMHISPFFQYAFTTAFDSGNNPVSETTDAFTYAGGASRTAPVPPANAFVQYGPETTFTHTIPGPVKTITGPFYAGSVASGLNIDMHTFALGVDLTKDITSRVHLVLSTGPTLNLFDTGLTSMPVGLGLLPVRSDNSTVRFGWVGQLGVQFDLDSKKRWFVEASGNYHWVTPFTVSTALSSARIQASSWGAELGVGLRF